MKTMQSPVEEVQKSDRSKDPLTHLFCVNCYGNKCNNPIAFCGMQLRVDPEAPVQYRDKALAHKECIVCFEMLHDPCITCGKVCS